MEQVRARREDGRVVLDLTRAIMGAENQSASEAESPLDESDIQMPADHC
jgi:hypothetical protein